MFLFLVVGCFAGVEVVGEGQGIAMMMMMMMQERGKDRTEHAKS